MEIVTLSLFCFVLIFCILFHLSVLWALVIGFILFSLYAKAKHYSWLEIGKMSFRGVNSAKHILINFMLIGILTASWRASGTIAVIICSCMHMVQPGLFLLLIFWFNCMISAMTGTAFGTSATMGVICVTMANAMQINPLLSGGAVLSGAFFGDRCSPLSTSALLVSQITATDIFVNVRKMFRSALIPFLVCSALYFLLGVIFQGHGNRVDVSAIFSQGFQLNIWAILPAIIIIVLSVCRVNVKITMSLSILSAFILSVSLQSASLSNVFSVAIFGYHCSNPQIAAMLDGGGIVSMLKVTAIVAISSAYSGIFQTSNLLSPIKEKIHLLSGHITPFGSVVFTSVFCSMIACNQTLAIMLTDQLCQDLNDDKQEFAMELEDSVVLIAPLIPWSIAGGVPIASIGAPTGCIIFAFFLYSVPLWHLYRKLHKSKHSLSA